MRRFIVTYILCIVICLTQLIFTTDSYAYTQEEYASALRLAKSLSNTIAYHELLDVTGDFERTQVTEHLRRAFFLSALAVFAKDMNLTPPAGPVENLQQSALIELNKLSTEDQNKVIQLIHKFGIEKSSDLQAILVRQSERVNNVFKK